MSDHLRLDPAFLNALVNGLPGNSKFFGKLGYRQVFLKHEGILSGRLISVNYWFLEADTLRSCCSIIKYPACDNFEGVVEFLGVDLLLQRNRMKFQGTNYWRPASSQFKLRFTSHWWCHHERNPATSNQIRPPITIIAPSIIPRPIRPPGRIWGDPTSTRNPRIIVIIENTCWALYFLLVNWMVWIFSAFLNVGSLPAFKSAPQNRQIIASFLIVSAQNGHFFVAVTVSIFVSPLQFKDLKWWEQKNSFKVSGGIDNVLSKS